MKNPDLIRKNMRANILPDEGKILREMIAEADLDIELRKRIVSAASDLIREIRSDADQGLMETFLGEYGLSTDEGIALMCLAEALLRVPDAQTIDALIEDKIAPSNWSKHLGQSSSPLVNASTWALLLTGKVLSDDDQGVLGALRSAVKRLGEPVIRTAVSQAMREMGKQFVLGRDIDEAIDEARLLESEGFTYSYDMLGEAACTEADAKRYHLAYSEAIASLAKACTSEDIRENPGISVKLSALHPRYEFQQQKRVMEELVPRTRSLALLAKSAGMGFNIDAEEADRLDLSLDVIEAVLADPSLKNWDGFGIVVQAYGPRCSDVIDWLYNMAERLDRKIMVRLVKGAYWDTEIKLAQTLGLDGFPVFTRKTSTDVSYIANAKKLLGLTDRIYPQFATHNAHTVSAVVEMAKDKDAFEFQRLHGMGEALHKKVMKKHGTRCRIYAPVGAHRDLLAYLVRRLLENGANSSFVNQIIDEEVAPEEIAADPFVVVENYLEQAANPGIANPLLIYGASRKNARGWDLTDPIEMAEINHVRDQFKDCVWQVGPMIAGKIMDGVQLEITNPANPKDVVGHVMEAGEAEVEEALNNAKPWQQSAKVRAEVLNRAADLYEENAGEFFALAAREAGKTLLDCVGELREAVDFLRYYANQALEHEGRDARGIIACISPWNFPLAIFTGQMTAALAAGNAVIVKPAEATPLIAGRAVQLLHEAGVPQTVLQFLPGKGSVVGARLSSDARIAGMCFTGSTATAQTINRTMAMNLSPSAPLIAETGGLNAMIVDSTALPEQAVRDIIASAFQSAGQRCSALRVLYVQEDVAETILTMLQGAMDDLRIDDPWQLSTDVGPVIDEVAQKKILNHIESAKSKGNLLKQLDTPTKGTYVGPAILKVNSIVDLEEEIFGPVLHVATFAADEVDKVIKQVNGTGYGLTFGLHTRIDDRVQHVVDTVHAGNVYVNRNQIGAVVGSQPFGGEGLSGTGPKAGGPNYLQRFLKPNEQSNSVGEITGADAGFDEVQKAIDVARGKFKQEQLEEIDLPGPTGESNRLTVFPKGVVLCLGPDLPAITRQVDVVKKQGCEAVVVFPGSDGVDGILSAAMLTDLEGFNAVCFEGEEISARAYRAALAEREGEIIPLIAETGDPHLFHIERHVCVDTTASGGNAALLAAQS